MPRSAAARDRGRDSVVALVLVGCLAAGVILASDVFGSGSNVETLLFGSLLLVDGGDIALAAVAAVATLAATRAGRPALAGRRASTPTRRAASRPAGARSRRAPCCGLIALATTAALSVVGALLVAALFVVPAATARLLTRADAELAAGQRRPRRRRGHGRASGSRSRPTRRRGRRSPASPARSSRSSAHRRKPARARRATRWRSPPRSLALAPARRRLRRRRAPATPATARRGRDHHPDRRLRARGRRRRGRVDQILQPNTDPHEYEPRPSDVEARGRRRARLRQRRQPRQAGSSRSSPTAAATPRSSTSAPPCRSGCPARRSGAEASKYDPHWWHDPRNAEAAVRRDRAPRSPPPTPRHRREFDRNADAYLAELRALDAGIAALHRLGPAGASASWSPTTTPSATSPSATGSTSSAP